MYIISGFMRLTREEAMAIRWHMGFSGPEDARTVGQALRQYPLAWPSYCGYGGVQLPGKGVSGVKIGILFDLDGTLGLCTQVCAAFNRVFDRHPELHKHLTEEELRGYMGKQRMEVAAVMMPMAPPERWYDLMEELFAEQLPYLREHHAAPYPHLVQTLEALSRDYPLAIVSNCQTVY